MKKVAADNKKEECANCAAPEGLQGAVLKRCSKCQLVVYCSQACQIQHWRDGGHKRFCLTPSERAQAPPAAVEDPIRKTKAQECAICSDELVPLSACTLACGHSFHTFCVASLRKFGVSLACPLCRAPLPSGETISNQGAGSSSVKFAYQLLMTCTSCSQCQLQAAAAAAAPLRCSRHRQKEKLLL